MRVLRGMLGLLTALCLGACANSGIDADQLTIANDSANAIEAMVWAGEALPPDPQTPVKLDQATTGSIGTGELWRVNLPAPNSQTGAGATSIVATVAVRAQGQSLDQSQWINVEGPRPWALRVFGEAPNLRVARVLKQDETGRMRRTVGPRPPSVGSTGGFGSGPQR